MKYACLLASASAIASCAMHETDVPYSTGQLNRRVEEAAGGIGVAGALVVFQWDRSENDIGHGSRTHCVRLAVLHTDLDGKYTVPSWGGRHPMIASIYKPGYVEVNDPEARVAGLEKLKKTTQRAEARIEEMKQLLVRCSETEDRKLEEYFRALYEEARAVASTPQGRRDAEKFFLSPLEASRLGAEEARRRAIQREIQR